MQNALFTLGYEGLSIDAFIARLQAAQVKTIVDVRELPLSRKKSAMRVRLQLFSRFRFRQPNPSTKTMHYVQKT